MDRVIPKPVSIEESGGTGLVLPESLTITATDPALAPVADLLAEELSRQLDRPVSVGENGAIRLELADTGLGDLLATQGVRADDGDPAAERYGLEVTAEGARIWAPAPEGIYRGASTLRQLIGIGTQPVPAVRILDAPRFAWRGFSLDTCRRFFPPDEVKQIIDLLALYKVNVFHLHLTDGEGWRIEIPSWPKLAEIGGATASGDRPGGFYTQAEYRDLVAYAAARFITVVPEFDMPGHTAAIFRAYPELAGDGSSATLPDHAMLQYLHPDNPRVFPFVTEVIGELAALTPGAYLHMGGDEAFGMPHDLYTRFVARAREIGRATGKKLVAWQEATRSGLAPDDLMQYWLEFDAEAAAQFDVAALPEEITLPNGTTMTRDVLLAVRETMAEASGDVDRAVAAGNRVIVSLNAKAYLDTPYAEASSDPAQEAERGRLGMPFYPKQTVAEYLDWEPARVHPRLPAGRIAGVEGALWCESVTSFTDALFLLLPRFPGIAERAWSPEGQTAWENYRGRLAAQASLWERAGWTFFRSSLIDWPQAS